MPIEYGDSSRNRLYMQKILRVCMYICMSACTTSFIDRFATVAGLFAERHFAKRHFAERTFCRRTFCRTDVLPNGHFAERTFRRTDILPNGQFAERTVCRK